MIKFLVCTRMSFIYMYDFVIHINELCAILQIPSKINEAYT